MCANKKRRLCSQEVLEMFTKHGKNMVFSQDSRQWKESKK